MNSCVGLVSSLFGYPLGINIKGFTFSDTSRIWVSGGNFVVDTVRVYVHSKLCSITPVATKSARDITEFCCVNMDA